MYTQMNIYVGNLPFNATEDEIRELFSAFGQVTSVALIKDKLTGKPRGFGFVEMPSNEEAQKAIDSLNNSDMRGRNMVVNPARPREEGGERRSGGYQDRRYSNRDNRSHKDTKQRKDSW
jgi:RNA recognition motif-containing protein